MASKTMADIFEPFAFGMQIIGAGMTAKASASKSVADRAAFNMQATALTTNAELDRAAAGDAIRRGQTAQVTSQLKTRQLKGEQIARMAANGIALDEGSALNTLSDTDLAGINDVNLIALNAEKEAWGFNLRASNNEANADLMRKRAGMESPTRAAATSLLTSAGTVASRWYSTRNPGA